MVARCGAFYPDPDIRAAVDPQHVVPVCARHRAVGVPDEEDGPAVGLEEAGEAGEKLSTPVLPRPARRHQHHHHLHRRAPLAVASVAQRGNQQVVQLTGDLVVQLQWLGGRVQAKL